MAVSEDAQAIIDAINEAKTVISSAIGLTNNKLDTIIPHARNIDQDLDIVIDKESRVIRGMGLQGQALNASVSYKIKDPNGEQILNNLNNLDNPNA